MEPNQKNSEVKVEYSEIQIPQTPGSDFRDLSGMFPTITGTPTGVAKKLSEQFKIGTGLWVYDAVNAQWIEVGGTAGCRLRRSGTQAISGTTTVSWDAEDYDTDTMHDNSTNPERITINTAGKYMIECMLTTTNTGTGTVRGRIRVNNTTYIAYDRITSAGFHSLKMVTTYNFAVGDYVEVIILEDIGSNYIDTQNTDAGTHISVFKI